MEMRNYNNKMMKKNLISNSLEKGKLLMMILLLNSNYKQQFNN